MPGNTQPVDQSFRPPQATRLEVRGGASRLPFDGDRFGAIGGRTRLQSDGFEERADHHEITIGGGASRLTVEASGRA